MKWSDLPLHRYGYQRYWIHKVRNLWIVFNRDRGAEVFSSTSFERAVQYVNETPS